MTCYICVILELVLATTGRALIRIFQSISVAKRVESGHARLSVMDATDSKDHSEDSTLENLPTELLVYIASFLSTIREKAKLRYVSRRLRSVGEASSLWSEFVWPQYDSREELCVKNLLGVCAHHVKTIGFPDGVRLSVLLKPLSRCYKLTQLSLPTAELDGLSPDKFRNTLQHMEQLERLEICWNSSISPLLSAGSPRLKELTVHVASSIISQVKWGILWAHEWVTNKFVPQNLNIVIEVSKYVFIPKLLQAWPLWNSFSLSDCTAELKLYSFRGFKVPLNLFNALPMFQLHFSQTAMLPFVKAATFGLLGIEPRLLMLTDKNGKAEFLPNYQYNDVAIHDDQLDHHVTSLSFITHFDARGCQSLHSGHLEQLAAACPNLQRLDLESKYDCLGSLQGLHTIANCCHSLEGLNLQGIGISKVENCMQLWEILSGMQLTHLAVETCVLNPFTDGTLQQQLAQLFQKFLSLKALECSDGFCEECRSCCEDSLLLCKFPSLVYCKMHHRGVQNQSNVVQNIINNCKKLECFNINCTKLLSLSSLCNNNSLLQLCIKSDRTILTDDFMKTLSVHGGLVHVVLFVFSVTCSGIITLITNSPKLLTLHIATHHYDEEDNEFSLEATLSKKFSHRKLFTAGRYSFEKKASFVVSDTNILQQNTDLLSLWS